MNRRVKLWYEPVNELPWRSLELHNGVVVRHGGARTAEGAVAALNLGRKR